MKASQHLSNMLKYLNIKIQNVHRRLHHSLLTMTKVANSLWETMNFVMKAHNSSVDLLYRSHFTGGRGRPGRQGLPRSQPVGDGAGIQVNCAGLAGLCPPSASASARSRGCRARGCEGRWPLRPPPPSGWAQVARTPRPRSARSVRAST